MKTNTSIAVVVNFKYAWRHLHNFIYEIRHIGKYYGDIVIVTGKFTPLFFLKILRNDSKIKIFRFSKIVLSNNAKKKLTETKFNDQPNRFQTKKFQWHKLHLFDESLKAWNFIFYLDVNMKIHHDINPLLELRKNNKLLARADSYPEYKKSLSSQFDKTIKGFEDLNNNFDLNVTDYFQTGLMFYDTSIITNNTKNEIINLVEKYPLSVTNEQGIMNIYFMFIKKCYLEFPEKIDEKITYFYWMIKDKEIVITKQGVEKYK